ncbi:GH25 family lysozyme [Gryllotalpicola ginsengisoli]|uniref:GH25 family lysozyme n=1 Tax=Gryllotalpicola ginsengisoli TaxID=444608 RepID=UPI0003B39B9D|nr:GH25 family lysozyme [Gryllotalpicola ginsengisoli]
MPFDDPDVEGKTMRRIALTVAAALTGLAVVFATAAPASATDTGAPDSGYLQGFDVSNFQPSADIAGAAEDGAKFVFVKSGDTMSLNDPAYTPSSDFDEQWEEAGEAGLIRGAYVVAGMGDGSKASDPRAEADAFADHVGELLSEPNVLPPVVDLEAGKTTHCWMSSDETHCWMSSDEDWVKDLSANRARMVTWLQAFSAEVKAQTGRTPIIYTNSDWWNYCTGGSTAFAANRLWIADWSSATAPTLPKGWSSYAFWQWREDADSSDGFPGDQDVFHGTAASLQTLLTPLPKKPKPTVTGTVKVGNTLTAHAGDWGSAQLRYQWYASSKAISGATSSTLPLSAGLYGKTITVHVIGSEAGYAGAETGSTATARVAAGTLKSVTPTISGTLAVGHTLTAVRGTWTSGTTYSYQWYASSTAIKGATGKTLKLTSALRGKTITVHVTGRKTGYVTAVRGSARSAPVR